MNENTVDSLIRFIETVSRSVCRCSAKEILSGHHIDCMQPELQEKAVELANALRTDETLLRL